MSIKFKRKIIVAKIETTYGVDSTPTGAANAVLASNVTITPLDEVTEKIDSSIYQGAAEEMHVGQSVLVEFEVDAAGSGTAGAAPAYGPLMRGCGLKQTLATAVSANYTEITAGEESLTMYMHIGGQKFPILGMRGSVSLQIKSPGRMIWKYKMRGLFGAPSSVVDPTVSIPGWTRPVPVNNTNTIVTLHGFAVRVSDLSLDQNKVVTYRNLVGVEEIAIGGREWKGSITIELPTIATKDFISIIKSDTFGALSIAHGTVSGNSVHVNAGAAQLSKPKFSDADGIAMLQMDMALLESSATNDEITISTL